LNNLGVVCIEAKTSQTQFTNVFRRRQASQMGCIELPSKTVKGRSEMQYSKVGFHTSPSTSWENEKLIGVASHDQQCLKNHEIIMAHIL
jgi:hypothetical protein